MKPPEFPDMSEWGDRPISSCMNDIAEFFKKFSEWWEKEMEDKNE